MINKRNCITCENWYLIMTEEPSIHHCHNDKLNNLQKCHGGVGSTHNYTLLSMCLRTEQSLLPLLYYESPFSSLAGSLSGPMSELGCLLPAWSRNVVGEILQTRREKNSFCKKVFEIQNASQVSWTLAFLDALQKRRTCHQYKTHSGDASSDSSCPIDFHLDLRVSRRPRNFYLRSRLL